MYLADVPCHVVARGNNRASCFPSDSDRLFYLACLNEAAARYRVDVHAYVLMSNHVHLLMTPRTAEGISLVMQSVGRRYVQRVNRRYQRTGTLWEGRHKASLVEAERYLLACYRYIEMNPVRAGIAGAPGDYRWSSYAANALGRRDDVVTLHPVYEALGPDRASRIHAYAAFFDSASGRDNEKVRAALRFSVPLAGAAFVTRLEKRLGARMGHAARGRPRKMAPPEAPTGERLK